MRKHAAGPRLSWAKVGSSGIVASLLVWGVASTLGSHGTHATRATALASAFGSSASGYVSPSSDSEPVELAAAMPVVPGLAQAAIRQPASVGYATIAPVGGAAARAVGVAAQPAALEVTTIPRLASVAYQRAATTEAHDASSCGVSWEILAGIGLVESDHGRSGGSASPSWSGVASPAIFGPVLNGQDGFPVIKDTDHGVLDGDPLFDRAVGPMQFLPATWREYDTATSGSAAPNPENISDAAFAAARYLCASGADLRTSTGLVDAIYGYNHSFAYVTNVVTAAQRYAEGTLQGAAGALAELPALLSGQPTASFVTDPVVLASGTPGTSSGSPASGTSAGTSPSTTRSAIVGAASPDPDPTVDPTSDPIQDPTPAPTDSSPSDSSSTSDSPAPDTTDSPAPDSSTSDPSATDSASTSDSDSPPADTSAPGTSAPDTSSPTPSLPPTPTPTPTITPTPTLTPTQPTTTTPTPPPATPGGSARPGPTNTGVPAGTQLTVYNGDLTITTPGATYADLDIHGFIRVEAPDVTIKDSIIRGGPATSNTAIIYDLSDAATNLVVEDSEIMPADPSVFIDGIDGWNYTALRLNIHGTVDGAKMFGTNATIEHSWIHDLVTYAHDPSQNGGQTHNDDVQILSGSNLQILGNDLEGGSNSAIQL
ncbi:MAG TPA: hypothetical protein VII50_01595, partial [Acidothermaceae bacterium]